MVRIIRRKFLFIIGVLITGLLGSINSYVRTNYSKDDSLLTQRAHADTPAACGWCGCPYTVDQCNTYYYCFPSGTFISTPSGNKEIQGIVEGDVVYGFDIETGVKGEYSVTKTFKHGKGDVDSVYSPLINIMHTEGGSDGY